MLKIQPTGFCFCQRVLEVFPFFGDFPLLWNFSWAAPIFCYAWVFSVSWFCVEKLAKTLVLQCAFVHSLCWIVLVHNLHISTCKWVGTSMRQKTWKVLVFDSFCVRCQKRSNAVWTMLFLTFCSAKLLEFALVFALCSAFSPKAPTTCLLTTCPCRALRAHLFHRFTSAAFNQTG